MEAIIFFLFIAFGGWIFKILVAAAKSAVTGESFSEAMGNIPPLEVRLVDKTIDDDPDGLPYKSVEIRGLFPVSSRTDVSAIISIFDETNGKDDLRPIISLFDQTQEPDTMAFQQRADIGLVMPDQGFKRWVEIGRILPIALQAPHKGSRQLRVHVRLVDTSQEPQIELGFANSSDGVLWVQNVPFKHEQAAKGYRDESADRDECFELSVSLAVAVAMSDGELDDSEGMTIQNWIKKVITPFSEGKQHEFKERLNSSFRSAFQAAETGSLALSPIVARLNEIAEDSMKFEAMELCYEVMAADGTAAPEEMDVLRRLGTALELDVQELERVRDMKMIGISQSVESAGNMKDILGIDPNWDQQRVRGHLRKEFQKWNSRIANLPAGEEREHAQQMLDLIGEARKTYG